MVISVLKKWLFGDSNEQGPSVPYCWDRTAGLDATQHNITHPSLLGSRPTAPRTQDYPKQNFIQNSFLSPKKISNKLVGK